MARKTYLVGLLMAANALCKYIRRWDDQIRTFLPEEHHTKLDAVLVACDALELVLRELVPGNA